MVAVKQYPHFLYVQGQSIDSTRDADGNWVAATQVWTYHSTCREETNGKGAVIQGADAGALVFSSLVLLPRGATKVPEGKVVRACDTKSSTESIRIEKPVLKCDISPQHGRIWL